MLSIEEINKLLGVDESYKASSVLFKKLMSKDERQKLFKVFLAKETDLTFDWFTDYFQEEHSDRKKNKQDFTPDGVVTLVNRLLGSTQFNADICAGTGGLTIKRWSENKEAHIYCEEYSDRAMPFLLFNLAIRNMDAVVFHGDSLTRKAKGYYRIEPGKQFADIQKIDDLAVAKAETVVMNPPYSFKWKPVKEMLDEPRFKPFGVLAPKSKADFAFLLEGLNRLSDAGTMAIILPHGVLFRGQAEGKIRQKILELGYIDTVIGLPEKLFFNTDIPTVIVILRRHRADNKVFFIDASKEFTKHKNHNRLEKEHIEKILAAYHDRKDVDKFAHLAGMAELKENDFNLNIPRYVDTFEPEPVPSLTEITADMQEIDKEIEAETRNLSDMFSQLVGTTPEADREIKAFAKYWSDRYG
ncbi:N-6 DNA methylase [Ligilactobacillus saerimneri]